MSYRPATENDLNKHITAFFKDNRGSEPATEQPTVDNIKRFFVLTTLGENISTVDPSRRGGSRRRPSRKYKKSAKRVFRKKSRSTRRR